MTIYNDKVTCVFIQETHARWIQIGLLRDEYKKYQI